MKTFVELASDESGTIYVDSYENGIRYIIMRGPVSLCAYMGVPVDHPLAGFDYDSIPAQVHGGLTYAAEGNDDYLPHGWFWYGWDYAHSGDRCFYDLEHPRRPIPGYEEKEWTVEEIQEEVWDATYYFEKLKKLIESVVEKRYEIVPVLQKEDSNV